MTSAVESGSMIASSRARRRTDVAFDRRAGPAPLLPMGKDAAFISKPSVVVKGQIALPAETIKDN